MSSPEYPSLQDDADATILTPIPQPAAGHVIKATTHHHIPASKSGKYTFTISLNDKHLILDDQSAPIVDNNGNITFTCNIKSSHKDTASAATHKATDWLLRSILVTNTLTAPTPYWPTCPSTAGCIVLLDFVNNGSYYWCQRSKYLVHALTALRKGGILDPKPRRLRQLFSNLVDCDAIPQPYHDSIECNGVVNHLTNYTFFGIPPVQDKHTYVRRTLEVFTRTLKDALQNKLFQSSMKEYVTMTHRPAGASTLPRK